jgi:hypothetical protein
VRFLKSNPTELVSFPQRTQQDSVVYPPQLTSDMHFLRSILVAAACLTLSASAAPISDLSARDVEAPALVRRVLNAAKLSQHVVATQKGQAHKQTAKAAEKKKVNTKTMNAAPKVKAPEHKTAGKSPSQRKELHQKANNKAKAQAVTHAQKTAKADRTAKWGAAKGKPGPAPKAPKTKLDKHEKGQVKGALKDAAHKMKNTANIPHKNDKFTVGGHTSTGKDVRKAVMNSHLHAPAPVGRGDNKLPKEFRNDKYSPTHGDASLRGQRPINNPTGAKLHEYPVTKQGQGWVGSGAVGPHRAVTSNSGGKDTFHGVIGHDTSRGGDKDDHYLATKH